MDIAAFFVDLTSGLSYPPLAGGDKGDAFFNDVVNAVKRGVQVCLRRVYLFLLLCFFDVADFLKNFRLTRQVRLVQQEPSKQFPDTDR